MINTPGTTPLFKIVSNYPKVVKFRDNIEKKKRFKKHIILAGGSITVRDACVDFVSGHSFNNVVKIPCLDKDISEIKSEIYEYKNGALYSGEQQGESTDFFNTLCVLYDVSEFALYDAAGFKNGLMKNIVKNNLFVATVKDVNAAKEFSEVCPELFEFVDISSSNKRSKKCYKVYPPGNSVDTILSKYVKKYPDKTRSFIVDSAMPEIEDAFKGKNMHKFASLETRITGIRKKSNNSRLVRTKRSYGKINRRG